MLSLTGSVDCDVMLDTHAGIPNALEGKGKIGRFIILYWDQINAYFRSDSTIQDPDRYTGFPISVRIDQPTRTDRFLSLELIDTIINNI